MLELATVDRESEKKNTTPKYFQKRRPESQEWASRTQDEGMRDDPKIDMAYPVEKQPFLTRWNHTS